ncbi:MAG: aminotransferase class I/II-fold pyridoxal phosphate-dependent enzyme [Phycisphaerae bacterium]|nr:aminotransferase class I/II-fold pyridoxal phosphate-dependent enzyme [Phycisphaerae bacterium]
MTNTRDIAPVTGTRGSVRLSRRATDVIAYSPPVSGRPIDLFLDANEGPRWGLEGPEPELDQLARLGPDLARRYPSTAPLERTLAARMQVDPACVLVTAGGDDAIDRACRACLEPGRTIVVPVPTFEMIERNARLAGAEVARVPWPEGEYPIQAVLGVIDDRTAMIAVVSPNNPTGAVASRVDLEVLSAAAPEALLLVDLAYTEFADEDLTRAALALPNAVVVRTFSKAFGLAGLRVGYAIGPRRVMQAMRAMGSPFPVSSLSLAVAASALEQAPANLSRVVSRVREERGILAETLRRLGARPKPSQANFVLAEFDSSERSEWVWYALAGLGIGVRMFAAGKGLDCCLRITCPGEKAAFERLTRGLGAALRPEAVLLDMDGVLADVSASYRRAIVLTAKSFGVALTAAEISRAKSLGDANNDWVLTHRLVAARGVSISLADITARFESIYQGTSDQLGLRESETLIPDRAILARLAARSGLRLGIVTGRPRTDCERFLRRFGIADLFQVLVCMEDAAAKPSPAPVRLALDLLDVRSAWLIGDTPDDIVAARGAAVVPLGIPAPGDTGDAAITLTSAGAAIVLTSLAQLETLLP